LDFFGIFSLKLLKKLQFIAYITTGCCFFQENLDFLGIFSLKLLKKLQVTAYITRGLNFFLNKSGKTTGLENQLEKLTELSLYTQGSVLKAKTETYKFWTKNINSKSRGEYFRAAF
jgi:hypothetical protein